jgi:hypothetical protein
LPSATVEVGLVLGFGVARAYGYTRHVIRLRELQTRIVYLRRGQSNAVKLVDLPPIRESERLTRAVVESLGDRAEIPGEDFGL